MPGKLLIISKRNDDVEFGQALGQEIQKEALAVTNPSRIETILLDEPQSLILWDAEDPASFAQIAKAVYDRIPRYRVFIVTDQPLNQYPDLFSYAIFGHHLLRRFAPPAPQIVGRVMQAALDTHAIALERFFPVKSAPKVQRIQLLKSSHKGPAVEAVQNFLLKLGTIERLASKVAQASDELLMNAIFDAPVLKDGTRYRREGAREKEFPIDGGVTLAFGEGEHYAAISVSDNFGSLDKEQITSVLKKGYQKRAYVVRPGTVSAGLGLHNIIQTGLSVVLVTRPKLRTEAVLFFPKVTRYKDLREGFSFFGVIGI